MARPDDRAGEQKKDPRAGNGKNRDPRKEHEARKPSGDVVADYHSNSDVDAHAQAQHHTLGFGSTQASPGDHRHDGNSPDSVPLWTNVTLNDPGAGASTSELAAAIAALNTLIRQKSG